MNVLLFFAVVILAIILGEKTKINYGIFAFAFAFILAALYCKMAPKAVIALFPVSIFFNMFIATAFYGFGALNGSLKAMSNHIMYAFRGAKKLAPLTVYVTGYIIALCGADTTATTIFMCPIAFGMASTMGFNPLLGAILVWCGAISGTRAPWGVQSVTMSGLFAAGVDEALVAPAMNAMFIKISLWALIIAVVSFIVLKGYKTTNEMEYKKPDPMTADQKFNVAIMIAVAVLLIVPNFIQQLAPNPVTAWMKSYLTIQSLSSIGMVILAMKKVADPTQVIKTRVPWTAIVMVCGMAMLISLAKNMGVMDTVSGWLIEGNLPKWTILPILALICGILSFFVSGMVVIPLLTKFLPALATATGVSIGAMIVAIVIGLSATSISPFSEGGAIIIGCVDETLSEKLANKMMLTAVLVIIVTAILAAVGFFGV